ncbi:MAG: LrgB family protein [Lachnospiraceae bacterium]|nr:LrgB family protein [Lachnospiraceae bacterium]
MGFIEDSLFFGLFISLLGYEVGVLMKRKWKIAIFNPLLVSIALIILLLKLCHISYGDYNSSAKYISYLLTPATVCLGVPLYEQMEILKKNAKAILCGIIAGVLASMGSVLGLSVLFGLSHEEYVTLLPKSITTAIGMGVSQELGGIVTITVAVIVVTGIVGNILAEGVCRLARIEEPVAKGIGIGSSAHAMGTTKAMEMGEVEGAMSGLSIAVSGLITVAGAALFANFY